jgi:hypothetical protein
VAESFFSSLKKERIKKQTYKNRERAKADVAEYIDSFYNRIGRYSHLGGLSPEQFEAAHTIADRCIRARISRAARFAGKLISSDMAAMIARVGPRAWSRVSWLWDATRLAPTARRSVALLNARAQRSRR